MQPSPKRVEVEVRVLNSQGLHMRPVTELATTAGKFTCTIQIVNGKQIVDGKSPMDLMLLGATKGTALKLVAEGDDAEAAIAALVQLFKDRFHVE